MRCAVCGSEKDLNKLGDIYLCKEHYDTAAKRNAVRELVVSRISDILFKKQKELKVKEVSLSKKEFKDIFRSMLR